MRIETGFVFFLCGGLGRGMVVGWGGRLGIKGTMMVIGRVVRGSRGLASG